MAIKKSQLYSTLWESCNALRGSMDASQYKDYVLIVLFVKYLSDKARQHQTRLVIPPGCAFDDFVALKQNDHIGEEINKKLEAIKEANRRIIGDLVLPNFNDATKLGQGRSMVKALSDLVGVFENDALDFSKNRAADDDLLDDAYEYLMKNFAAESGKSKGQFYTPAEVSRIMAKVLGLGEFERARDTIYDPTFGTGIPASILVLNKRDAAARKGVFFIDAKDGFMKDGPKNRLREQDIRRIVDAWDAYRRGRDFEIPHFSHFATWQEIEKNDFNLNIPRYVAARDASVSQDLDGHLRGGVSSAEVDSFAISLSSGGL